MLPRFSRTTGGRLFAVVGVIALIAAGCTVPPFTGTAGDDGSSPSEKTTGARDERTTAPEPVPGSASPTTTSTRGESGSAAPRKRPDSPRVKRTESRRPQGPESTPRPRAESTPPKESAPRPTPAVAEAPAPRRAPAGSPRKGFAGGPGGGAQSLTCELHDRLGLTWYYNWTTRPSGCDTPFVPMITTRRGGLSKAVIRERMTQLKADGYRTVLGFNEPDSSRQSDLSVGEALSLWPAMTSDASIRVASPAATGGGKGLDWMGRFMDGAKARGGVRAGYRFDILAAHRYGKCTVQGFSNWLDRLESIDVPGDEGKPENRKTPIWITEFGCNDGASVRQRAEFLSGLDRMLREDHPRVERFALFGYGSNVVRSGNGLNAAGQAYASMRSRQ